MVRQKLEENRRVFEKRWFEKKPVQKLSEPELEEREKSGSSFEEKSAPEPDGAPARFEEQEEDNPIREVLEQEILEPLAPLSGGNDPVRELSDELERLAQRYGRGMEEWLYDQSSI